MDREYYCHECHFAYASNADVNQHHKETGHIGFEVREVIRRNLRVKRNKDGSVASQPAFKDFNLYEPGPTQEEIDATLASIGQAVR